MISTVKQNLSWNQPVGISAGTMPYSDKQRSKTFNLDDIVFQSQREEERNNKVNQILPFPLDQVSEQAVIATEAVQNMISQMLQARRSGILSAAEKKALINPIKRAKKIKRAIRKIVLGLDKMKL